MKKNEIIFLTKPDDLCVDNRTCQAYNYSTNETERKGINEMINSAIIWKSEMNDIYGVVGFDSETYDHYAMLSEMVNNFSREYRVIEAGDKLEFTNIEDEDDEAYQYLISVVGAEDLDNSTIIVVTGHELTYKE